MLVSVAVSIALGATSMSDIALLAHLAPVLGAAPSGPTVRRALELAGAPATLDRIARARAKPAHAWALIAGTTAGFPWLVIAGKTLSEFAWTARDETTYITFPLTMVHFACCRLGLIGDPPPRAEDIDQAAKSLRLVLLRLDDVLSPQRRSELTRRAVEIACSLETSLLALAPLR